MLSPRFSPPDNPSEAFFDFPRAERHATLCQSRLFERYKENWRTPRAVVSVALSSDNEQIADPIPGSGKTNHVTLILPDGSSCSFNGLSMPGGASRASHDGLVSNTFGFSPFFGTGHVLRTNGVICLFWNGEEVNIVELSNIKMLRVLLDGEKKEPKKKRVLAAAMQED